MKNSTQKKQGGQGTTPQVLILAAVLIILKFLPLAIDFDGWWGLSHAYFMSLPALILTVFITVMFFVFLITPAHKVYLSAFEKAADKLFGENLLVTTLIFGLVSGIIFWFLRMPANLLGDGYTVINNIGNNLPVIFKWSEMGSVHLVNALARIIPVDGLTRGEYAYAIISVISGGFAVVLFYLLAREFGEDNPRRLAIFLLLILAGWTLLFFGYAENYPVLWPVILFYIYAAMRHSLGRTGLAASAIAMVVAIVLHLQALFLVPSFIYLIFCGKRGNRLYHKYSKLWLAVLGASIIAAVFLFVSAYRNSLELRYHLLPLFDGKSTAPDYAVFSWRHWRDIANELFLLIPVCPILIMMAMVSWGKAALDNFDRVLLLLSGGGLLFLFAVDPQIGMGRDWDLFALSALGPALFFLRRAGLAYKYGRTLKILPILALALILPFLTVNLSKQPSIEYVKYLLTLEHEKSRAGIGMLRDYFTNTGNYAEADSLDQVMRDEFPAEPMQQYAVALVRAGRNDEAMRVVDSLLRANPYRAGSYFAKGVICALSGEFESARDNIEEGLKLSPYEHDAIANLALIYGRLGDQEKMMSYLRRAQKLNPNSRDVIIGLIDAFEKKDAVDSVLKYSKQLLDIDPRSTYALLKAGVSSYNMGDDGAALNFLNRYAELIPKESWDNLALEILNKLNQVEK